MLVALDEDVPLPALTKAANVAGPLLRSVLRRRRNPPRLFAVACFLIKRTVHANRVLRTALLRHVHTRRRQITTCVEQWQRSDFEATMRVGFLHFAMVFVPAAQKHRIVVAHRLRCCHEFVHGLRRFAPVRRDALSNFYQRAFSMRTVSSRTSRIVRGVVDYFVCRQGPAMRFHSTTIAELVNSTCRVRLLGQYLRDLVGDRPSLAVLDDAQLTAVTHAVELMDSGALLPVIDASLVVMGGFDAEIMRRWCDERRQHAEDLPDDAFQTHDSLVAFAGQRVVPPQVVDIDREAIAQMNDVFRAAWRAKGVMQRLPKTAAAAALSKRTRPPSMPVSAELTREMTARNAKAEHDRLRRLAAELTAGEAFTRRVCVVGDAWIDEPHWASEIAVNAVRPSEDASLSSLQALLRGLREARCASSVALRHMALESQRMAAATRSATRKSSCSPLRDSQLRRGNPRCGSRQHRRRRDVENPSASCLGSETAAAVPHASRRSGVTSKALTGPPSDFPLRVERSNLIPRGASSVHPYPMLRQYLEGPRIPVAPPQTARVISRGRFRSMKSVATVVPAHPPAQVYHHARVQ